MTVIGNKRGEYRVCATTGLVGTGSILAGPFETQAEAWRWIDRHSGEPISPAEKKSDWIVGKILGGGE